MHIMLIILTISCLQATKAGDVFAFGGVLLVLITGRPMFMKQANGNPKTLMQWVRNPYLLRISCLFRTEPHIEMY